VETIVYREATIDEIYLLRFAVLRPGRVPERIHFAGDELGPPLTWHFGAFERGGGPGGDGLRNVGCLTLFVNVFEGRRAIQLRGMAVAAGERSRGIGSRLLERAWGAIREDPRGQEVAELPWWCNARVEAIGFYQRNGWEVVSEVFTIEGAGLHRRMVKGLK
jgi:GNAT superfamily N-acetyltransferase